MKILSLAFVSGLALLSSLAFARPMVKLAIQSEVKNVDQTIMDLQNYEQHFWAIGLNGDTLQPDGFLRFFVDRDLNFKYFVRSGSGVVLGEASAYQENRQALHEYKARILDEEMKEVERVIADMETAKAGSQAVGLVGDTVQPDQFITFFVERSLELKYYIQSPALNLGDTTAYDQNIQVLKAYEQELRDLASSSPDQSSTK